MTMQDYKASQARAAKLQELFKTDPEKAKEICIRSFDGMVEKIKKFQSAKSK